MKHLSGYDNMHETEAWYLWGNMKVLLGHLDGGPGSKGPHSDPADKTFLGLCCQQCFKVVKLLVKSGVKTSAAGYCTI